MVKHPPWLSVQLKIRADAAYGNYPLIPDQKGGLLQNVWTEHGVSPQQVGGLLPHVWSEIGVYPQQQGDGFGSILRGLVRFFKPIAAPTMALGKSALKAVGKQALASAGGLVGDLVSGANLSDAAEYRLREGVNALGEKAAARLARMSQTGSGYKRNKKKSKRRSPYSLRSGPKVKGRVSKRRVSKRRRTKPKKQAKRKAQKRKRQTKRKSSKRRKRTTVQSGGELLF
jgi:hypothetical protein